MTSKAVIAYALGLPLYVMVKAMAPNFFARGDTKTPVKYSAVVLLANLMFSAALMVPFGHVGIATATTIAAFVSVFQYVRGLKKRGYWSFSAELKKRMAKIFVCSTLMGVILYAERCLLTWWNPNWLEFSVIVKLLLLGIIGSVAVLAFLLMIKMCGIVDVFTFGKNMMARRRKRK